MSFFPLNLVVEYNKNKNVYIICLPFFALCLPIYSQVGQNEIDTTTAHTREPNPSIVTKNDRSIV